MTTDGNRPKLTYFNFRGKAQPLRWAMKILGVDYVDNVVSIEWFKNEMASKSPNGFVPLLEDKGEIYSDTLCIMRYIAGHMVPDNRSLMPDTDLDDLHAVSAFCMVDSVFTPMADVMRYAKEELREERVKEVCQTTVPAQLKALDLQIATQQDNLGHIVSHKLTYVDLYVAGLLMEILTLRLFFVSDLDQLVPHCFQTLRMVLSIPAVRSLEYEFDFKSPILNYFSIAGRGEGIRLCFAIGGIPFEDRTYDMTKWDATQKKLTPTGQLPMLEFEDKFYIVEVEAILNWIGEKAGMTPTTLQGKTRANALYHRWQKLTEFHNRARDATDPEATKKKFVEEDIPQCLQVINSLIPSTATWCADVKLTWIDVYLASQWKLLASRDFISDDKDSTKYPQLYRIHKQVYDLPAVKDYFATHSC